MIGKAKRRQSHKRQGQVTPKFSFTCPPDLGVKLQEESDRAGRTKAAVVVDRLRDSYGIPGSQPLESSPTTE